MVHLKLVILLLTLNKVSKRPLKSKFFEVHQKSISIVYTN